jgi:hypothetical protein
MKAEVPKLLLQLKKKVKRLLVPELDMICMAHKSIQHGIRLSVNLFARKRSQIIVLLKCFAAAVLKTTFPRTRIVGWILETFDIDSLLALDSRRVLQRKTEMLIWSINRSATVYFEKLAAPLFVCAVTAECAEPGWCVQCSSGRTATPERCSLPPFIA